jgi:hypothetical protein
MRRTRVTAALGLGGLMAVLLIVALAGCGGSGRGRASSEPHRALSRKRLTSRCWRHHTSTTS